MTAQLLANLASRHHVAVLYLRAASEPPVDAILQERCGVVEEVPRPEINFSLAQRWRRFTALLRGKPLWAAGLAVTAYEARVRTLVQMWQPDLVHIEYHVMGQYLSALDTCLAPRVLVEYEPGVRAARDLWQSHRGFARLVGYVDLLAWKRYERGIIRQVQTVVVFTAADQRAVAQLAWQTPVVRIPFGTVLPESSLNPLGAPPLGLLFVGSFLHPPNVDAALRLINTIFPSVHARYPGLLLYVVGDQPTPEMWQAANKNIVVTGRVPDVTPYLDRAALVVVPLRLGGGMRVKVLEALAAGKAVVASPLAIEGLDLVNGEQVVLAESDEQFCDAITQLLANPEKRASLATRARAWACANLGWDRVVSAYETLYGDLIERSGVIGQTR